MKLHSLRTRGIGMPFRAREVSIDFDALPDGLVALVGDNGSGKTHVLSLSGEATLFRSFASYGESVLDHVAPGVRDAFAELVFSLGPDRFRATLQADPQFAGGRGKSEALLARAQGSEWVPVAGPLVRDYDDAIGKILPSKELFLASVFACQGGDGSFFDLGKADRKSLFSSMLGLAHLQEKCEDARGREEAVLQRLSRAREQIGDATVDQARVEVLETAIASKSELLGGLDAQVAEARGALDDAQQQLAGAKDVLARAEADAAATSRDRARIETEKEAAQQQIGALSMRLEQIAATLARAEEVRGAVARLAAVDDEIRTAREGESAASEKLRPLDAQIATLDAQRASLAADHKRLTAEVSSAKAAAARVESTSTLERDMADRRDQLEIATAELDEMKDGWAGLELAARDEAQQAERRRALAARREDLSPRKELLDRIPGVPECEGCPLTADARAARDRLAHVEKELADLPLVEGTPARDVLLALRDRQERFEGQRALAQKWIAENAPRLERLARDQEDAGKLAGHEAELARIAGDGTAIRAQLDEAREARACIERERDDGQRTIAARRDARQALADLAAKLEQVSAAEAQKAEVEQALSAAKNSWMAAGAALAELPSVTLDAPRADVTVCEGKVVGEKAVLETATDRANAERGELAKLTGEREALGNPAGELEELRTKEAFLVRDSADWSLLERALGRDGVQALAIDAAGPTVSAIANDLLSACYGPRFSLSLETTAMTKDGKKQKEVFDVRILDAEAGREAKQASGGETVLLDEALRLALAIFNTQRSGVPLRTLWRDETTGALSPDKADRYVAMLRRAMEIGGFERCLFITHQPEVSAQADARIFIANGAVSVEDERAAA